ncbi:hypothetical protein [Moraxella catarrhalis]|uniref:hypothetical protein n=1 Tax=Moraxella catarrhalis TaxID=480 RepID=UPI0012EF4CF4|nr:hypothetical protein [Moraxella catarrhalis]MPX83155.1 hypothetical protein [Moraxella catarrhalis]
MPIDEFIIKIYLMVDDYYKKIVTNRLRQGGYTPKLTDRDIITMELVGEFLQMDTDSQIHQYFKQHWQAWFPNLGSYPNFAKQCVNLLQVKTFIQQHIIKQHGQDNIHFIRARDLWHLSYRFMRKILAYNFCFVINKQLGNPPLQFELLISS